MESWGGGFWCTSYPLRLPNMEPLLEEFQSSGDSAFERASLPDVTTIVPGITECCQVFWVGSPGLCWGGYYSECTESDRVDSCQKPLALPKDTSARTINILWNHKIEFLDSVTMWLIFHIHNPNYAIWLWMVSHCLFKWLYCVHIFILFLGSEFGICSDLCVLLLIRSEPYPK